MSTRRYATVIYGYNLPVDFGKSEEIDPNGKGKTESGLDVVIDGMSGEYFLVGKTVVDVAMDSYETDGSNDAPKLVYVSFADKAEVKKKLTALFPDHTGILGPYYVTRYV